MSDGGYKAAELYELLQHHDGDFDANIDAILSDSKAGGDILIMLEEAGRGDGMLANLLREQIKSDMLRRARQQGDVTSMSAATGFSGDGSVDVADWKQIQVVQDFFRNPPRVEESLTNTVFQCVLFSSQIPPTGRGKTSTAYWLIENAEIVEPGINVLTNNPSDEFDDIPEQWEDLKAEIRSNDGWSVLMLDESAQFLQFADQGAGKEVSQMMKLLRHNQCHLILVGHTGMDVPKDIRRQMFFIEKKSKKAAEIGYGLEPSTDGETLQVADVMLSMTGVPHTSVEYESQGEEAITIEFDDEDGEESDEEEQVVRCRGTKTDGSACNSTTKHESGYCHSHRHQWDGDSTDPRFE